MTATNYPLVFKYHDLVQGNGYIAAVQMRGRALMAVDEDGDAWFYGVTPSGISDGGGTQKEAAAAFREAYREVLLDVAHEAPNFFEFQMQVKRMAEDESERVVQRWNEAVQAVREGLVDLEWLDKIDSDTLTFGVDVLEVNEPKKSRPSEDKPSRLALASPRKAA